MGVPCNICGKSFSREDNLKRHVFQVHSAIGESFKCTVCAKEFSSQFNLQRHSSVHDVSGSTPKNFICEICGSTFQRSDVLAKHVTSHEDPSNKCNVCGKSFSQKSHLKRHLTTHNEETILNVGRFVTNSRPTLGLTIQYEQHSWSITQLLVCKIVNPCINCCRTLTTLYKLLLWSPECL
jgi:KRAB domain-containing zinc finger protein